MENILLKKKVNDFLVSDEGGEGKKLSKKFRDGLTKFIVDLVSDEVRSVRDSLPISVSAAGEGVANSFSHFIGDFVYYVIFKQVRSQVPGKLRVHFGWQFTVLSGKIEEIQIRTDHGILYKINNDLVLQDVVFSAEEDALAKCKVLNAGTASVAICKAEHEAVFVPCDSCGKQVDVTGEWYLSTHATGDELFKPVLCKECYEKALKEANDGRKQETSEEVGEAAVGAGAQETGADSEGKAD